MIDMRAIKQADPELAEAMMGELQRQRDHVELIASENYVSEAVMAACGSHLTNKYAEGYPARRYYGGCEWVDRSEQLAIDRFCKLFGVKYANVQPHSGSQANMAVYQALLNVGDTIMGMNLAQGGHLTHGSSVNFSGKAYRVVEYGVDRETERIDYQEMRRIALECRPRLIIAGASAYARLIDYAFFRQVADEVGAYFMVDMAHVAGLVASRVHPSPCPYAHVVTTTTHKTLRGPRGGVILTNDEEIAKKIDKAIFPGCQGGPLEHIVAAKAVAAKEAMSEEFAAYGRAIVANAKAMEEEFRSLGVPMVTGGTDNHLLLLRVSDFGLSGKKAEQLLDRACITANKNAVPFDTAKMTLTSGLRIGTPAITTRGFDEQECREVARLIYRILVDKEAAVEEVKSKVGEILARHPLYDGLVTL